MAENKTKQTDEDVDAYLQTVANERRRADAIAVKDMMQRVTGEPARMWGTSMIGFGSYAYTYASGHSGEYFLTGLAPRARALTIYIMLGFKPYAELMARLGKHKTAKSCLYITDLAQIDMDVLEELIERSVADLRDKYSA